MIDEPDRTEIFISKLRGTLPLDTGLTRELQRLLAAQSPETPIPARCQVVGVFNLGDDGGVGCSLDIGGPEATNAHIVSITHLIFNRRSPLFRDIDAYQRRRIKKLKRQRSLAF